MLVHFSLLHCSTHVFRISCLRSTPNCHVSICHSNDRLLQDLQKKAGLASAGSSSRFPKGQSESFLLQTFRLPGACRFLAMGQQMSTREKFARAAWRTTPLMNALSDQGFTDVKGNGAHKRTLQSDAAEKLADPYSQLSLDLRKHGPDSTGFACTLFFPHTCSPARDAHAADLKSVSEVGSVGPQPSSAAEGQSASVTNPSPTSRFSNKEDSSAGESNDEDDDDVTDTSVAESRGGRVRNPGYTTSQLAAACIRYFRTGGRDLSDPGQLSATQVRAFLQAQFGQGRRAKKVLHLLRQSASRTAIVPDCEMYILQGLVQVARKHGHYCALIYANGAEVRQQALALARARYYKRKRRELQGSSVPVPPFDEQKAELNLEDYPDTDNAGLPLTYVIGWILVPNYMRTQINFFVPWSAIDVTHAKTATGAQGVFYLEATLDGNNHVHPVSIAHLYTSENLFGYGVMHAHSLAAYEPVSDNDSHPLLAPGRVVCGDGNVAIPTALGDARPESNFIRDIRHLKQDMRSKRKVRRIFEQLYELPPSKKGDVLRILDDLNSEDPASYAAITAVPLEQWCPSFMPEKGINTHGNHTSNAVEILALMIMPLRKARTLATSLRLALVFVRRRHMDIKEMAFQCRAGVPPRVERHLIAMQERAHDRQALVKEVQPVPNYGLLGQHVTVTILSMCVASLLLLHFDPPFCSSSPVLSRFAGTVPPCT